MATMQSDKIATCEQILGFSFKDKLLCLEALQMSGNPIVWNNQLLQLRKNEGLAVLGDTVLKSFLCKKWYETKRPKGQWTVAEQALVQNKHLTKIGFAKGMENCIIPNGGTVVSDKMMATTVEALIGAAYVDAGDEGLAKVIAAFDLDNHEYFTSPA